MTKYTKLTNEQWQSIEDIVPACKPGGRPEKWSRRDIVDAILYKFATECSWRQLPSHFPKWNTVFVYYNRWRDDGTWINVLGEVFIGFLNAYEWTKDEDGEFPLGKADEDDFRYSER